MVKKYSLASADQIHCTVAWQMRNMKISLFRDAIIRQACEPRFLSVALAIAHMNHRYWRYSSGIVEKAYRLGSLQQSKDGIVVGLTDLKVL